MIKVTDEMIEAGQQALVDDGFDPDDAGECDLRFVFSAMYEAAPCAIKAERLSRFLESTQISLAAEQQLAAQLMRTIFDTSKGINERLQDFRMTCMDAGWCLRCHEYHANGFCDSDD